MPRRPRALPCSAPAAGQASAAPPPPPACCSSPPRGPAWCGLVPCPEHPQPAALGLGLRVAWRIVAWPLWPVAPRRACPARLIPTDTPCCKAAPLSVMGTCRAVHVNSLPVLCPHPRPARPRRPHRLAPAGRSRCMLTAFATCSSCGAPLPSTLTAMSCTQPTSAASRRPYTDLPSGQAQRAPLCRPAAWAPLFGCRAAGRGLQQATDR